MFERSGQQMFDKVSGKMKRLAYGNWKTMLDEALVRACVIRYMMDHHLDQQAIDREMQLELAVGFIWIDKLVDLLGTYSAHRADYPNLEKFIPKVAAFYDSVSGHIEGMIADYEKAMAHVSSLEPALNMDSAVNPTLTQLKVYFDKPLAGKGVSINYGPLGKDHFPVAKFLGYADENKAILLQLALKPDTEYQLVLTGLAFKTADGHPLESYTIQFKTGK
jgi:hypothetical protein